MANPVALATAFNTTNNYLYIAIDKDQVKAAELLALVNAGKFTLAVDYPYTYYKRLDTTSQNTSQKMSRAHGIVMKRVYHSMYTTGSVLNRWNHSNFEGAKVSQYQTFIDSLPIQNYQVNVSSTQFDDWRENQYAFKGSCVQGYPTYAYHWCHMDNWDGLPAPLGKINSIDERSLD